MSGYALFAGTGSSGHEKTATNLALVELRHCRFPPARLSVGGRTYGMASGHFRCPLTDVKAEQRLDVHVVVAKRTLVPIQPETAPANPLCPH